MRDWLHNFQDYAGRTEILIFYIYYIKNTKIIYTENKEIITIFLRNKELQLKKNNAFSM